MKNFYYEEVLTESYKELARFSKWLSKYHGNYPMIAGGWAVWAYTKGRGSRDIDVVFPTHEMMHKVLLNYFQYNGYQRVKGEFTENYVKKLRFAHKEDEIYIDACTQKDISTSSYSKIRIPWGWAAKHSKLFRLKKQIYIYIPAKELLLVQKMKALLDRTAAARQQPENAFAQAKALKDCYDIVSLISKGRINKKQFKKFLKLSGLNEYLTKVFEEIEARKEILDEFRTNIKKIKGKILL